MRPEEWIDERPPPPPPPPYLPPAAVREPSRAVAIAVVVVLGPAVGAGVGAAIAQTRDSIARAVLSGSAPVGAEGAISAW